MRKATRWGEATMVVLFPSSNQNSVACLKGDLAVEDEREGSEESCVCSDDRLPEMRVRFEI